MILVLVLLSVLCTTLHALVCTTPPIIPRENWEAKTPTCAKTLDRSEVYLIFHHTNGGRCTDLETCKPILTALQDSHMTDGKLKDIGYNFLIDDGGNVYQGRGWDTVGGYDKYYVKQAISIAFIGTFICENEPTPLAKIAAKDLIACAVEKEIILAATADNVKAFRGGETIYAGTSLDAAITAKFGSG